MFGDTQLRGASRIRRALAALCAITLLTSIGASASFAMDDEGWADQLPAENPNTSPAMDVLVLRPLGFASLLAGIVLFIPAAAITSVTRPQEMGKPFRELVVEPARYVWADGIGKH